MQPRRQESGSQAPHLCDRHSEHTHVQAQAARWVPLLISDVTLAKSFPSESLSLLICKMG